jgi:hypothetical protein
MKINLSKMSISELEELQEKIKKEIKDRKDYRKAYYEEHKKIELLQAQLRYYKNKIKGEKHE